MRGGLRGRLKKVGSAIRDFGERAAPVVRKGLQYGAVAAAAVATGAKLAHDIHSAYQGGRAQHLSGQPRSATIDHVTSGIERYNAERVACPTCHLTGEAGRWETTGGGRGGGAKKEMPHLLELFSGTGSIGRVFQRAGWEVTSVDNDPKSGATIIADVNRLTLDQLPPKVDLIWASPPCTQYSRSRTSAYTPRDLVGADRLVQKTLDIIAHYPNTPFFIENPQGMLKDRPIMQGIPLLTIDYCQYRDDRFPPRYRKRTNLFTNASSWFVPRDPCNRWTCPCCDNMGKHIDVAQGWEKNGKPGHAMELLYAIPPQLAEDILACWSHVLPDVGASVQ